MPERIRSNRGLGTIASVSHAPVISLLTIFALSLERLRPAHVTAWLLEAVMLELGGVEHCGRPRLDRLRGAKAQIARRRGSEGYAFPLANPLVDLRACDRAGLRVHNRRGLGEGGGGGSSNDEEQEASKTKFARQQRHDIARGGDFLTGLLRKFRAAAICKLG